MRGGAGSSAIAVVRFGSRMAQLRSLGHETRYEH
jgi:hypothetical protein